MFGTLYGITGMRQIPMYLYPIFNLSGEFPPGYPVKSDDTIQHVSRDTLYFRNKNAKRS